MSLTRYTIDWDCEESIFDPGGEWVTLADVRALVEPVLADICAVYGSGEPDSVIERARDLLAALKETL